MREKVSKNLRNYIIEKKKFRKRIILFFILMIYIPVSINLYNVYITTIEITKNDVVNNVTNSINRTSITAEIYLQDVYKKITETSELTSLRKVIAERKIMTAIIIDKSDNFFIEEFKKLKNDNVSGIFCITKEDDLVHTVNKNEGDIGKLIINSAWYKDFMNNSSKDIIMHSTRPLEKDGFVVIKKLKGVTYNIGIHNTDEVIGTIVFVINSNVWDSLNSVYYGDYNMSIYNGKEILLGNDYIDDNNINLDFKTDSKQFLNDLSGNEILLVSKYIKDYDLTLLSHFSTDKYFQPIINSIRNSILMILIVGFMVIIAIFIEMMIVSKLTTDKQMSQLRLLASEEANQRFSIFKHDLMNHIQIIQGLMQMNQCEKALEYSQSLTKESKLLVNRWRIGIPELESALFQSLSGLQDSKIELKFDFCTLPQDIPVKIYDLSKILVNLIKNAKYALENTIANEKILEIKIYEALGEYVFEVSNNVPLISKDIREKIFEKGFTTKGTKGNGLGLHIVKTLTERNRGTLELKVDETGNHFIVRFPN